MIQVAEVLCCRIIIIKDTKILSFWMHRGSGYKQIESKLVKLIIVYTGYDFKNYKGQIRRIWIEFLHD